MNSIFCGVREAGPAVQPARTKIAVSMGVVLSGIMLFAGWMGAQGTSEAVAEFQRISSELSAARLGGTDEDTSQMEKALAYLDSVAASVLNGPSGPALDEGNQRLARLVSREPPVGENYRLVKLGGAPSVYAMVINFGLGGPAAVRIYAGPAGHYALAARIDHLVEKDFFDSDLELVPVSRSDPVFVTVSGRTDDLSTGLFSAWRFDGHRAEQLWNSDLVQESSYEAEDDGFRLAYCSQVDEDHPSECLKMSRDLYRFQGGEWKRVESVEFAPTKRPVR